MPQSSPPSTQPNQPANKKKKIHLEGKSPKFKGVISIRAAFTSLTVFLLAVTGVFIITLSYQGSLSAIINITDRLVTKVNSDIALQTQRYFIASTQNLNDFENSIHTFNLLDPKENNREKILTHLANITRVHEDISAVYFGEEATGNFYMAKRMPNNSISKRTVIQSKSNIIVSWFHETPTAYTNRFPAQEAFSLADGYDPRKRAWYQEALTRTGFTWTSPYIFASDNKIGISVTKPFYRQLKQPTEQINPNDKDFVGVMAVDFTLDKISNFLEQIDVLSSTKSTNANATKDYYIFLMSENRQLLATSDPNTPAFEQFTNADGKLDYKIFSVTNVPNNLIKTSYMKFVDNKTPVITPQFDIGAAYKKLEQVYFKNLQDTAYDAGIVSFDYANETYLVAINNFAPTPSIIFKLGVVFNEALVTGPVTQVLKSIVVISVILLLTAIFISLRILKNITNPIIKLSQDMDKVRRFELDHADDIANKQNFLREINNINSSYTSMKNGLYSFKKFVPSEVVSQLVQLGKEAHVSGEKLNITIFFSDIEKFTIISEETPSEELVTQLRYYLSILSNAIAQQGGTLDKYIGDSIMAFWGAPISDKEHALNACKAGLVCRDLTFKINKKFEKAGLRPMRTRFGIHTGTAIVGNIGSDVRLNYTAIGDNVNLASRIEGLNKLYNTHIIISDETYQHVREIMMTRLIDKVSVYGKKNSITVYELIDFIDNVSMDDRGFYTLFNEGTEYYFERKWNKAIKIFKACLIMRENDGPSKVLLKRCFYYTQNSPAADWEGIFTAVTK